MEIARKQIQDADLLSKENEIISALKSIKEEYDDIFDKLGCEIEAEYVNKGEYDDDYSAIADDERKYAKGYVSRAKFTIKKKLQNGETVEDLGEIDAANDTDEELERKSIAAQRELDRTVAYTGMMMVRIYKTFWSERVSIGEELDTIKADLDEFAEKIKNGEAQ